MKLNFKDKFEIQITDLDRTLSGTYKKLTKAQEKELQSEFSEHTKKEKLIYDNQKQLNKMQGSFEIAKAKSRFDDISQDEQKKLLNDMEILLNNITNLDDETRGLQEELNDFDISDKIASYRLKRCLTVDEENKELLLLCIENVGSAIVYQTVIQAVEEGKQKDAKN